MNDFDQRSGVGVGGSAFVTACRLPAKRPAANTGYSAVGGTESGNVLSAALGSPAMSPFPRAYLYDACGNRANTGNGLLGALPAAPVNHEANIDDGWNRIAECTGEVPARTYTWGLDLSGTMQDAGGVGGLLAVRLLSSVSESSVFYPTFDGNGNISEYLAADGSVAAHFEYDPFGNIVKESYATGFDASSFTYKFSTKPLDPAIGLYYYGYRWYDPLTGRWPSRDPIGEEGGLNLYGFVGNNGLNNQDVFGAAPHHDVDLPGQFEASGTHCPQSGDSSLPVNYNTLVQDANAQFNQALAMWLAAPFSLTLSYGQDEPWTKEIKSRSIYYRMRVWIMKRAKKECSNGTASSFVGWSGPWDDSADDGPFYQPVLDLINYVEGSDLKSLGSNEGRFTITNIDCDKCKVSYDMLVTDAFRLGSATRIPGTNRSLWLDIEPHANSVWGRGIAGSAWFPPTEVADETGPFHNLNIQWHWAETLCFFGIK